MPRRRDALALIAALPVLLAAPRAWATPLPMFGQRSDGRPVGPDDFRGWRLVYFGYTHCPDVCPLGLQTIADALDALGEKAKAISPIFVTVDPDRDTPDVMKDYVGFFHPSLVGVTPTADELKIMAKAWRVKYAKVEVGEGRPYLMDHTATILFSDPAGEAAGRFPHNLGGARLAEKIVSVMESRS
ncbi:MAG: SCO family protein [Hyphomicrobiales bacterium]|nr:SCO family protein [Hyphomicrobiales bacterium]